MAEENKQEEKKVDAPKAQQPPPPPAPPSTQPAAPQAAAAPPKPPSAPTPVVRSAAAVPVPPPRAPAPPPPPPPAAMRKQGRRGFLTVLTVAAVVLALAPYVPWGELLTASIKGSGTAKRQKVVVDNDAALWKAAAGRTVNVSDLNTFPPNSHWVITYPSSGDSTLDAQNTDTFAKFELIRLPTALGGDKKEAASFAAFSKVCVHLWCSPNYNPAKGHEQYECPCHGSAYQLPNGLAIKGPAAVQPPPTNAIPVLTLSAENDGTLYIEAPVWDPQHNGVIGLGRYVPGVTGG